MKAARWRVGFLTAGWWPQVGGVQVLTRGLAREFGRRGQRVFALSYERSATRKPNCDQEELLEGVVVRRFREPLANDAPLAHLTRRRECETQVLRWAADNELDLVHVHSLDGWGLGVPGRLRDLGVPCVWTWHDFWPLCPRGQMWHVDHVRCEKAEAAACVDCIRRTWSSGASRGDVKWLWAARSVDLRNAVESCARVYTPSKATRELLLRHELPDSIRVDPNGVSRGLVEPRREVRAELRVGVLGSVQPTKGVLELANWIVEIGEPFHLEVHGPRADYHGDRSYVEALEELAGTEARIHLGAAFGESDLPGLFAGLDLVAVPSLWDEVFGLVAREARAAGLPVFASDRGGLNEAAVHHIEAGDAGSWKRDLKRFEADLTWRRELSELPGPPRTLADQAAGLLAEYASVLDS